MKKIVLIAIIITTVIAGSVLIGGYLAGKDKSTNQTTPTTPSEQPGPQTETTQNQTQTYTVDEVERHNSHDDCWIIIDNNVYNVTNFLDEHPGGSDRIRPYCGEDATQAFNTQGGEGSHSSTARNLREQYLIGSLSAN